MELLIKVVGFFGTSYDQKSRMLKRHEGTPGPVAHLRKIDPS